MGAAARLMLQGGFGTLSVVDAYGKVTGSITDRDIAMAAATRQQNASHIAVHEVMSPRVRDCFAHDDIGAALKQMEEARVRRLPVLDATGHLTGILSIDDYRPARAGPGEQRHVGGVREGAPTDLLAAGHRARSRPYGHVRQRLAGSRDLSDVGLEAVAGVRPLLGLQHVFLHLKNDP